MKKTITLISMFLIASTGLWAQALPNPGFENWSSVTSGFFTYDSAWSWDNSNSQSASIGSFCCVKSTNKHSGTYAVELITKSILSIIAPGVITTGKLPTSSTGSISGGIAYTSVPDSIGGWYEYTPAGADRGFIAFYLFGSAANNADTAYEAYFPTPNAKVATYTYFHAALVKKSGHAVVNSIWLLSSSEGNGTTAVAGSTMYVDDLKIVNSTVGFAEQTAPEASVSVYPNPASGFVTISNPSNVKGSIMLYDITGRMVSSGKMDNSSNTVLDVNNMNNGVYIYYIVDENNETVKTGKLVIQK